MVRARFKVTGVAECDHPEWLKVTLTAVMDEDIPENERFSTESPSGVIVLTVNPPASDQFARGKEFYVGFEPAPEKPPTPVEEET